MASLTRIHYDAAGLRHAGEILARTVDRFPVLRFVVNSFSINHPNPNFGRKVSDEAYACNVRYRTKMDGPQYGMVLAGTFVSGGRCSACAFARVPARRESLVSVKDTAVLVRRRPGW